MYTIKQVSELLDLSIHTLRYYTDEGLISGVLRDKNNRRIFTDEAIDWLRGTKYLRQCGMSIEAIKEYHILCRLDGDDAIKERHQIVLSQLKIAEEQLEEAKIRVAYLTKKANHELEIINHMIPDAKNPGKKYNT
ncbi:MAG: MerR family transcriptional regulator [Coprobacillaceae bacterium]